MTIQDTVGGLFIGVGDMICCDEPVKPGTPLFPEAVYLIWDSGLKAYVGFSGDYTYVVSLVDMHTLKLYAFYMSDGHYSMYAAYDFEVAITYPRSPKPNYNPVEVE